MSLAIVIHKWEMAHSRFNINGKRQHILFVFLSHFCFSVSLNNVQVFEVLQRANA